MSRLLPFKSEPASSPGDPRVLDLGDEATGEALSALSSETARKILAAVYEEPRTPPELRDEVGTSLQNVHYHVENLREADLIEAAGTGYSEKGTEMTVYAPASEAVVLFAGREHDRSRLKTALSRLLGAVGLLAVASVAVRRFVETLGTDVEDAGDSLVGAPSTTAAADGANGSETPTETTPFGDTPAATGQSTPVGTEPPVGSETSTASGPSTAPGPSTPPGPSTTPAPSTPGPDPTPAATGTPTQVSAGTPTGAATETPTETPAATSGRTPTETATESAEVVNTATFTETPTATPGATDAARDVAQSGSGGLLSDPATAFFLGGLFMLAVVAAWWYLHD